MIGEASVTYTFPQYEKTPQRIKQIIPDARLIYIVRDPIKRSFSHYLYYRYYGLAKWDSFKHAMQVSPDCLGASLYFERIDAYLTYFDPENLLVLIYEDYVSKPTKFFQEIFRFLELDDGFVPKNIGVKTNVSFKSRDELLYKIYRRFSISKMRRWLEHFVPQNLRPLIRNKIYLVLGSQQDLPTLSQKEERYLEEYFRSDIEKLESFLKRDLGEVWRIT